MFSLFCKKERQWSNMPSSMFKTYEHCAPCLLGQETCITFFLIRFLMVLSKQNNKKRKKRKQQQQVLRSRRPQSWFSADHELCTDWGRACQSGVFAEQLPGRPPRRSAPSYVTFVPASVCRTRPQPEVWTARREVKNLSVCFPLGGGVLPFHFEDVCNWD